MTLATTGSMKNAALSWKDRRRRRRSSRERDRRLEAEREREGKTDQRWFVFLVFWCLVLDSPPRRSSPGVRVRGGKGRLAPPWWGQ